MPPFAPGWMMSSATSIDSTDAERTDGGVDGRGQSRFATDDPQNVAVPLPKNVTVPVDDTLRPWHFFVLVSLVAATAAVVLAREGRPEHLVLISLTIGAAGFAGAALYRTLAPLVGRDLGLRPEGLTESMRAVLEREKLLVLRAIKELEFDRAMGKLSTKDFDEMSARLRGRAMSLMRQLDTDGGYRELIERELKARISAPAARVPREKRAKTAAPVAAPVGRACACGASNDADAAFCKRCGSKLTSGTGE
jgi:hypothetical protein